jgi:hypothetical protein
MRGAAGRTSAESGKTAAAPWQALPCQTQNRRLQPCGKRRRRPRHRAEEGPSSRWLRRSPIHRGRGLADPQRSEPRRRRATPLRQTAPAAQRFLPGTTDGARMTPEGPHLSGRTSRRMTLERRSDGIAEPAVGSAETQQRRGSRRVGQQRWRARDRVLAHEIAGQCRLRRTRSHACTCHFADSLACVALRKLPSG